MEKLLKLYKRNKKLYKRNKEKESIKKGTKVLKKKLRGGTRGLQYRPSLCEPLVSTWFILSKAAKQVQVDPANPDQNL